MIYYELIIILELEAKAKQAKEVAAAKEKELFMSILGGKKMIPICIDFDHIIYHIWLDHQK